MPQRELHNTTNLGNPNWYSAASRWSDLVWTAGIVADRADGSIPSAFAEQVKVALDNLNTVLTIAGAGLGTLLKVTTYLRSLDDFAQYNAIYVERLAPFGLPPRTTVEVARFNGDIAIEIEAVAHVVDRGTSPA